MIQFFSLFAHLRDEVLTKNIFLEDEAKRKAEIIGNSGEKLLEQESPSASVEDSQQDDDIFYDSQVEEKEK